MGKKCCHQGCENVRQGEDGYKVSYGFMLWACPDHADEWRSFDERLKIYEQIRSEKYRADLEKFEEQWEERYENENPTPEPPPMQTGS